MSFWGVSVEKIDTIEPIPKADNIMVATLKGLSYKFVIGKGTFEVGDTVLYFPLDSILPDDLIEKMGLTGRLSGKNKNRIKTVKLRKQISQGIVAKLDVVPMALRDKWSLDYDPASIAEDLGVTKYEPPISSEGDVHIVKAMPDGVSVYDLENAERFPEVLEMLMACEEVDITEKLEGTNISVTVKPDGTESVCSHRCTLVEMEDKENSSLYWRVAREQGLIEQAHKLSKQTNSEITIFGELIGPKVQGNIYNLEKNRIYVYDAKIDGKWFPSISFRNVMAGAGNCSPVPFEKPQSLAKFLNGRTMAEASNGMSQLNPSVRREGLVIRPLLEQDIDNFGRLVLKQRSPKYLEKED